MAVVRTSLGLCAICTEPPYPDGDCECAVDMMVCDFCGAGPTDPDDVCGRADCKPKSRCPHTWGLVDRVRCMRREGHDGMHSGMSDGRKMVW